MRVVGGKTGADGRLFAYIVWTVPGGPAEKGGLQQGDKVILNTVILLTPVLLYHFLFAPGTKDPSREPPFLASP